MISSNLSRSNTVELMINVGSTDSLPMLEDSRTLPSAYNTNTTNNNNNDNNLTWFENLYNDYLKSACQPDEQNFTCQFYTIGYVPEKLYLVVMFGSLLSFTGVIQNLALFYMFLSRAKFRNSSMVFLGLAGLFDAVLDGSYILLMTVSVLYEHYESVWLSRLWHSYVRIINAASQTSMTASSFLLISATMERYRVSMNWQGCSGRGRIKLIAASLLGAVLLQSITYFELKVAYLPQCIESEAGPLSVYIVMPSCMATIPAYTNVFQFWIRKLATIISPFVLLVFFNCAIVIRLNRTKPASANKVDLHSAMMSVAIGKNRVDQHKVKKNRATRTMVIVASSYLVVHALNFVLASWEMMDSDTLQQEYFTFYSFAADICSILAIFGNVIRFYIYYANDEEVRAEFRTFFTKIFPCCCSTIGPPEADKKGSFNNKNHDNGSPGAEMKTRKTTKKLAAKDPHDNDVDTELLSHDPWNIRHNDIDDEPPSVVTQRPPFHEKTLQPPIGTFPSTVKSESFPFANQNPDGKNFENDLHYQKLPKNGHLPNRLKYPRSNNGDVHCCQPDNGDVHYCYQPPGNNYDQSSQFSRRSHGRLGTPLASSQFLPHRNSREKTNDGCDDYYSADQDDYYSVRRHYHYHPHLHKVSTQVTYVQDSSRRGLSSSTTREDQRVESSLGIVPNGNRPQNYRYSSTNYRNHPQITYL